MKHEYNPEMSVNLFTENWSQYNCSPNWKACRQCWKNPPQIFAAAPVCFMCKSCALLSKPDEYWTCIRYNSFQKLIRKGKQCRNFRNVQTRVFCFHESHKDGPSELHKCKSKYHHESSIFCLMHRSKTEPLPNPLCLSSVAQEYSRNNITKRKFSIDKDFRKKLHLKGREAFSRSG